MTKNFIGIFASAIIIMVAIILVMLTQINSEEITDSKNLKTSLYSNYETFKTEFEKAETHNDIVDYLYDWAISNGLSAVKNGSILQVTKIASDDYSSAPSVTLHVDANLEDTKNLAQSASIGLSTLIGASEYGEVSFLLTPSNNFDYYGASTISKKFLDADYFISLRYNEDSGTITSSASESSAFLKSNLSYSPSTYEFAYTMTLTGIDLHNNAQNLTNIKNPILEFGEFMSNMHNASVSFEYVDFISGNSQSKFPHTTSVTLLFDERNLEKFLSRVESLENSFDSYYGERFPDYSFTYTQVPVPSQVISNEDGLRVLAFLYTFAEDVYESESRSLESDKTENLEQNNENKSIENQNSTEAEGTPEDEDEKDILNGVSVISRISTAESLEAEISNYALTDSAKETIELNLGKSAALSKISISINNKLPLWSSNEEGNINLLLLDSLSGEGLNDSSETSFLPSSSGYFQKVSPQLDQIIFNTNNSESFEQTLALLNFIMSISEIE